MLFICRCANSLTRRAERVDLTEQYNSLPPASCAALHTALPPAAAGSGGGSVIGPPTPVLVSVTEYPGIACEVGFTHRRDGCRSPAAAQ
ncbi:hypothetical protein J6590_040762 [Homalodisca vitripennis]|nr:hypothetical protein J6590_040762 [Homalodisca vitripennis]